MNCVADRGVGMHEPEVRPTWPSAGRSRGSSDGVRLLVAFLVAVIAVGCTAPEPTPTAVAACNATLPNGDQPPGEEPASNFHGNGSLFTSGLAEDGEIVADRRWIAEDGSIGIKFAWWRAPGVGAAGDLEITGHEVNTGAVITASIPGGYGQAFQASGITFPTEGCYEITATSGGALLTFVTKITKPPAPSPSG